MAETPKKYGWFSAKAHAASNNIITYETPEHTKVIISNITNSPTDSKIMWDDVMCVGEVTKFISNKSTGFGNKYPR